VVDSLLAEAGIRKRPRKEREELIRQAVSHDRTGRAMFALGQLYRSRGGIRRRDEAAIWFRKAMEREPGNGDYRVAYAGLLWESGRWSDARDQARGILEDDPDHVEALYLAGRYEAREVMVRLDARGFGHDDATGLEGRPAPYRDSGFEAESRKEAVRYLTRALQIDPGHKRSRVLLGLVYYESGMLDHLEDLFLSVPVERSADPDTHFMIGLTHQARGDLSQAYRSYLAGTERMPKRRRVRMQSALMLMDNRATRLFRGAPGPEALRRFWTARDLLYLTPLNERLMEHCGRVAYVNLRYGDAGRRLPGWATAKGQAYIRYGRPRARRGREPEAVVEKPRGRVVGGRYRDQEPPTYRRRPRLEEWAYEGFRLIFEDTGYRDHWKFGTAYIGDTSLGFGSLVSRIPEHYRDPFAWERYEAPHQVAQFRGEGDTQRVEIYYALSGREVDHDSARAGVEQVNITQGIFLHDRGWRQVLREVGRVHAMPYVVYNGLREGYLFASERLSLASGSYHLAVEAEDVESGSLGTFRERLRVRRFGRDSLQVSSLLLARQVVERDTTVHGRDRYMILPNPLGQCDRYTQAHFYFEVYNLTRDAFGATQYRVTYQVRPLAEEAEEQAEWSTAVSYTLDGTRDWEPQYLALDLGGARPGRRAVRVVVADLQSGEEAVAETEFRVMW
jgi:GWxTD domain-containing protein